MGADGEYRVLGSYRMVAYARFLIDNYFSRTGSLCAAEGEAMRRAVSGDPRAVAQLSEMKGQVGELCDYFFDRAPMPLPAPKLLKFAADSQAAWNAYGVVKRGSAIE